MLEKWLKRKERKKQKKSYMALEIKNALKRDEFEIFLQPQVSVRSEDITGFEALIRWRHPQKGILNPGVFMPIIYALELGESLDYLVFMKVCAFLQKRQKEQKKLFRISCNFVREHFMKEDFVKKLFEICKEYEVSPRYLAVEILEGSGVLKEEIVQENIAKLHALGFEVYLDDCGAENSNMGDLIFHSITHIKIDKKLIDYVEREHVQILLQGLCTIAHKLSYQVVCEGVETQKQLEIVKKCGADFVQGFYFYRPMQAVHAGILYDKEEGVDFW